VDRAWINDAIQLAVALRLNNRRPRPAKTVPIAIQVGDTLAVSVGDVGKATISSFRDQAGKAASVQGTAAQGAFQSASMDIASCQETRWADPDMRARTSRRYRA
jgi:hypothetical protein